MNDGLSANGASVASSAAHWQLMYEQLLAKYQCLEQEIAGLQKERDAYLKAVYALLPAPNEEIDLTELLGQRGEEPTVDQILAEIRQRAEA